MRGAPPGGTSRTTRRREAQGCEPPRRFRLPACSSQVTWSQLPWQCTSITGDDDALLLGKVERDGLAPVAVTGRGETKLLTIRYTASVPSSGDLVRAARHQAGLSQVELASRAGVTQSVVSAYESGARQPSLPMLERLVGAAGRELELLLRPSLPSTDGPLGQRLWSHRRRVKQIIASHGLHRVRVFGSVARGKEGPGSDIDLLVDVPPGVGLFELGRCQSELESLLGAKVELVPAADLKPGMATEVLSEACEL